MIGIGINVPNFGPQTDARALLSWTRFAESNGFAAIVMSDHVAPTREVTDVYPPPFYDPLTTIAWLAGQSENLLFATSVLVVPYRHPLLTARISAMLHEISGGRFALGVGVGWSATEFAALGADYAHRGQITDHYLQVITTA
jgi:alkanesulfonate monooxygenase SsuD/methylene tetrahydromethanopterin reductase-like flavin-dependent oxidoreductase (luciferase family)